MSPNRTWRAGDRYWELWLCPAIGVYRPLCAGVVERVEGQVVHLVGGAWRFGSEGLPFLNRADAMAYANEHEAAIEGFATEDTARPSSRRSPSVLEGEQTAAIDESRPRSRRSSGSPRSVAVVRIEDVRSLASR